MFSKWTQIFLAFKKMVLPLFSKKWGNVLITRTYRVFHYLVPNVTNVGKHIMYLNKKDFYLTPAVLFGAYEKGVTSLFFKEVKKDMTVLDLGANVGYYTLISAGLVGGKGKVFAFEPDPTAFKLLKHNVEVNNYKNVTLVNRAVLNKSGKTQITLDEFFRNYECRIDFIKMDIEGAEALALKGMHKMLRKNKGVKIVTEFCPTSLRRAGSSPEDFLKELEGLGFKLYLIDEEGTLSRVERKYIMRMCHGVTHVNLLCSRSAV
jgi:SAM-dependent methyltransferase